MEIEKTNIFSGGGVTFVDLLQEIDGLPPELSEKLRSVVFGCQELRNWQGFEQKRNREIEELVRLGYFKETGNDREILESKYTKDKLYRELSKKRVYDFDLKSSTTKKEMVDYLLTNEKAIDRLVKKYFVGDFTEEFRPYAKQLGRFLDRLYIQHPYDTMAVSLLDFYNEQQEQTKKDNEELEATINSIAGMARQTTESSKKRKSTALLLCIFGGYFGLHQFYTGKIVWGVVYLLTFGLFAIGWVADIIRISTDRFKDVAGKPLV